MSLARHEDGHGAAAEKEKNVKDFHSDSGRARGLLILRGWVTHARHVVVRYNIYFRNLGSCRPLQRVLLRVPASVVVAVNFAFSTRAINAWVMFSIRFERVLSSSGPRY